MSRVDALGWVLRTQIYRTLAETGAAPGKAQLSEMLDVEITEVGRLLKQLEDAKVLALLGESGEVWMAHPLSAVPTPLVVTAGGREYFANCAWDAIALPMVLGADGETNLVCGSTGEALRIHVRDGTLEPVDAVIRFPVPARRFWDDIGYT